MRGRIVFLAAFLLHGWAAAGEYQPSGASRDWLPFLGELVRSLDVFGFVLLALFIVVVGMAIDAFYNLRIQRLIPEQLLQEIQREIGEGEYERALEVCARYDCMASQVFAAGLAKIDHSFERMHSAMTGEAEMLALIWRQWIGQFRTMAIMAPLLAGVAVAVNLLWMVAELPARSSIIQTVSFSGEMRGIANSLLMAVVLGMATTIVARLAHGICRNRLDRAVLECVRIGEEVLDPFRPLPQYMEE